MRLIFFFIEMGAYKTRLRPGLWMYEQKEQRVTPVPMIGVNCNLWCPGWDGKDLGGRAEQDPADASRLEHQYRI